MIIPFKCDSVRVTSCYGKRVLNGVSDNHKGYDMVGVGSSEVTAAVGGTVTQSRIVTDKRNLTWQWGNYVTVKGDDGNYYYYCHLASRAVSKGQRVNVGDKIGVMGATGYVFGAHLHFEVRKSDGKTAISPEGVLGIPNKVGTYKAERLTADDYIKKIVAKVGYDNPAPVIAEFKKVKHPFINDLWRKLYEVMK